MEYAISVAQIVVSVVLIALILLQERSSGISGVFGGDGGGFYQTRRGLERLVFGATIVFAIFFVGLSILHLVV